MRGLPLDLWAAVEARLNSEGPGVLTRQALDYLQAARNAQDCPEENSKASSSGCPRIAGKRLLLLV